MSTIQELENRILRLEQIYEEDEKRKEEQEILIEELEWVIHDWTLRINEIMEKYSENSEKK